jgi:hypothetical protein
MGYEFEKEAYDYRNYFGNLAGANAKELSVPWYIQVPYTPFVSAHDLLYDKKPMPELEDPMQLKSFKYRDKIDLIIDELGRRDKIKYDNLCRIQSDLLDVYQAKVGLDPSHFYTKSQPWRDLFSQELNLKQQIRSELRDMYRDTQRASEQLRDSLLEHKIQSQKMKMFSLEDVLD